MSTSQPNTRPGAAQPLHHEDPHHEVFPTGSNFIAWCLIGIVGAVLLFISLTAGELFSPGISPGDIAEKDIVAPHDASIVDGEATKKTIEEARQHVIPVFLIDRSKDQGTLDHVKQLLDTVEEIQEAGVTPAREVLGLSISTEEYLYALTCTDAKFQELVDPSIQLTEQGMAALRAKLLAAARPQAMPNTKARKGKGNRPAVIASTNPVEVLKRQRKALADYETKNPGISAEQVCIAISVRPSELTAFSQNVLDATRRLCQRFERFPVSDKHYWRGTVSEFLPDNWDRDLRKRVATLVSFALEPNVMIDPSATKTKADSAVRAVKPVTKEIKQGDIVVKRGDQITEDQQEALQSLSIKSIKSTTLLLVLGISLAAALGFFGLFLLTYEPKHFFSTTSIGLMYTVGIVTCATTSVLGSVYPQFVPIPAAALVLTIFFRRRVATALIAPLIVILSVDGLLSGASIFAMSMASLAAIMSYSKRRNSLMFTGFIIGVGQAIGYLVAFAVGKLTPIVFGANFLPYFISWLMVDYPTTPDIASIGLQFFGGIASSILAIGSLPFLENIFGLVTPYRLVELTDADQPLLRQLEEKAPGTYQHSLAVANLAEAGAKAINCDANLVRAGALYHDIGKMVKPRFFIENQLGATNPHDSMTPEESRERVLAHVTDGIELARKYSLPKAIQDFIPMHQGSTLMAYFYHKACQRDGVENVDAGYYRYPGPKPNTKETAIVMLADVSEAVTHSMKDPSEEEVDEAIDKVFENRWHDGQFNESTLTYDELHRVKLAFVRVWRTLHHDRLKYPSTTTGKMAVAPEAPTNAANSKAGSSLVDAGNSNGDAPAAVESTQTVAGEAPSTVSAEAPCSGNFAPGAVTTEKEGSTNGAPEAAPDGGPCDCTIAEFGPAGDPTPDHILNNEAAPTKSKESKAKRSKKS